MRIYSQPKFDWKVFRKALKAHRFMLIAMTLLGLAFMIFGVFAAQTQNNLPINIFGYVFFTVGLGVVILHTSLCAQSIRYYYQKGMLKEHGIELTATVTHKHNRTVDWGPVSRVNRKRSVTSDLIVEFTYSFEGASYLSEDAIDRFVVFDSLKLDQKIPVLILPYQPHQAFIRTRKISQTLKNRQTGLTLSSSQDLIVSQTLMDEEGN